MGDPMTVSEFVELLGLLGVVGSLAWLAIWWMRGGE